MPVADVEPSDRDAALEDHSLRTRSACELGHEPDGLRDPVGRHPEPTEDVRGIDQRDPLHDLRRRQQLGVLDPGRTREPLSAGELGHPLLRGRDLDPADAVPARMAVGIEAERAVEPDRVLRDPAHRPGAVRLEH
jgi:hypothetical protein